MMKRKVQIFNNDATDGDDDDDDIDEQTFNLFFSDRSLTYLFSTKSSISSTNTFNTQHTRTHAHNSEIGSYDVRNGILYIETAFCRRYQCKSLRAFNK